MGSILKEKNLLPWGANSFLLEQIPFQKGGKTILTESSPIRVNLLLTESSPIRVNLLLMESSPIKLNLLLMESSPI